MSLSGGRSCRCEGSNANCAWCFGTGAGRVLFTIDGRPADKRATQLEHVAHSLARYKAGDPGQIAAAQAWPPLPAPPSATRASGHRAAPAPYGGAGARVLLAQAW